MHNRPRTFDLEAFHYRISSEDTAPRLTNPGPWGGKLDSPEVSHLEPWHRLRRFNVWGIHYVTGTLWLYMLLATVWGMTCSRLYSFLWLHSPLRRRRSRKP